MGTLVVQDATGPEIEVGGSSSTGAGKGRAFFFGFVGTIFLLLFTIIKIPEPRLKSVLLGYLNFGASQMGVQILAPDSSISYWRGPEFILKNGSIVTAKAEPIRFDELRIKPTLLPLFLGKLGVNLTFVSKSGQIDLLTLYRSGLVEIDLKADNLDLKAIPFLSFVVPDIIGPVSSQGTAQIATKLNVDMESPHTLSGTISLKISKFALDSVSVMGLTVPSLSLSEVLIDLDALNGKLRIQKGSIGKANTADDIQATVAGDITLAKVIEASTVNLKTQFRFSEKILTSFSILDSVLTPGKKSDGSYAFSLTGSPQQPAFTPIQ